MLLTHVKGQIRSPLLIVATSFVATACGGPASSTTPPPSTPTGDRAEAIIGPAGGTLVTPSGAAGVQIPPGAFNQQVTVTITRLAAPTTLGNGPLPTALKQYPPFYEFATSPAIPKFGDSVRVGVCQVTDPSSALYAPEEAHGRLRLAHSVGSAIEILDRVAANDFLRCTSVVAGISAQRESGLRGFISSGFRRVMGSLGPQVAYAAHGGLGGKVKSFSPFGAVDPGDSPAGGIVALDLGMLSGALTCEAVWINESSDVIGNCDTGTGAQPFLRTGGVMTALPVPTGGYQGWVVVAMNKFKDVVGWARNLRGDSTRVFLLKNGSNEPVQLPPFPGKANNFPIGINDAGTVAGYSTDPSDPPSEGARAWIWKGGGVSPFEPPGSVYSVAQGINNVDQVTGYGVTASERGAWLSTNGSFLFIPNPSSEAVAATALNDLGKVAVEISGTGYGRAGTWSDGVLTDLGSFGNYEITFPESLNDAGQLVGAAYNATSASDARAFVWSGGKFTELRSASGPDFPQSWAYSINGKGQIVGSSAATPTHNFGNPRHPTLWTLPPG